MTTEREKNDIILEQVLVRYNDRLKYLIDAKVLKRGYSVQGKFCVPRVNPIMETSYVNAINIQICYNQLVFYLLGSGLDFWQSICDTFEGNIYIAVISKSNWNFIKKIEPPYFIGKINVLAIHAPAGQAILDHFNIDTEFQIYGENSESLFAKAIITISVPIIKKRAKL